MKTMKKALSAILAASMVMGMTVVSFADTTPVNTGAETVDITKHFVTVNGNDSTADTFKFTVKRDSYSDSLYESIGAIPVPYFDNATDQEGTISFEAGTAVASDSDAVSKVIMNLPTYEYVGIYKYTIDETDGTVAGIEYDSETMELTVTVTQDGDKLKRHVVLKKGSKKGAPFENTYNAGDLEISKTVTGNMGDHRKYFDIKVTLTGEEGKTYKDSFTVTGGSHEDNPTTIAFKGNSVKAEETFKLKHGETITIENLPYGVSYTVEEADYTSEGYDPAKYSEFDGEINSSLDSANIINNKEEEVATGIKLDNMPYLMMLAMTVLGAFGFVSKKRKEEEMF